MRCSTKNKFILISIPKCGTTSLRNMLEPYSELKSDDKGEPEGEFCTHVTASNLYDQLLQLGIDWFDMWSFTSIRNPWKQQISAYNYWRPDENFKYFWQEGYLPKQPASFNTWLNWKIDSNNIYDTFRNFAYDDNERIINQVILLEHFDLAIPALFERLQLPRPNFVARDNMARYGSASNVKPWYSKDLEYRTAKFYEEEIELGGYTFEGGFRPYSPDLIV